MVGCACYNIFIVLDIDQIGGRPMEITTSHFKRCDVVKVTARLDSATAPQLAEVLSHINDEGRFKIVMDFSGLEFISSAGLRVLIATLKTCRRYNRGDLVIAALPENIHAVFELAGFTALFKIYDDVVTAVGEF